MMDRGCTRTPGGSPAFGRGVQGAARGRARSCSLWFQSLSLHFRMILLYSCAFIDCRKNSQSVSGIPMDCSRLCQCLTKSPRPGRGRTVDISPGSATTCGAGQNPAATRSHPLRVWLPVLGHSSAPGPDMRKSHQSSRMRRLVRLSKTAYRQSRTNRAMRCNSAFLNPRPSRFAHTVFMAVTGSGMSSLVAWYHCPNRVVAKAGATGLTQSHSGPR
mmetsp:Transcript_134896/g.375951  ORF Transcript_134896/g.375951 Transcript_134896/m.375951 type:complete len:216 (+) Transcript_134896:847-1494(+)